MMRRLLVPTVLVLLAPACVEDDSASADGTTSASADDSQQGSGEGNVEGGAASSGGQDSGAPTGSSEDGADGSDGSGGSDSASGADSTSAGTTAAPTTSATGSDGSTTGTTGQGSSSSSDTSTSGDGTGTDTGGGGCSDNGECGADDYCAKAMGQCDSEAGTCEEKPTGCTKILDPVCGCDGKDYSNPCEAAAAGMNVRYKGECATGIRLCSAFIKCPESDWCDFSSDNCGIDGSMGVCTPKPADACPEILAPVCGCDGATHSNECEANSAGVDISKTGPC